MWHPYVSLAGMLLVVAMLSMGMVRTATFVIMIAVVVNVAMCCTPLSDELIRRAETTGMRMPCKPKR